MIALVFESLVSTKKRASSSKWSVREKRVLPEDKTIAVLARLTDPYLLLNETCISAGPRISEVLGLPVPAR